MGRLIQPFQNINVRGTIILKERAFASLPSDPQVGELANISNSSTSTAGQTVTEDNSTPESVLARFDGSVWKVVA